MVPTIENIVYVEVPIVDPIVPLVDSSKVSSSGDCSKVDDIPLKSVLLSKEVMDRYLEWAKKLRAEFKRVVISDHDWWLKTFDLTGNRVVKLWCGECKKYCGGGSIDDTKVHIDNLFNNFRKSHIVNASHVRNFGVAKNVDFDNHP